MNNSAGKHSGKHWRSALVLAAAQALAPVAFAQTYPSAAQSPAPMSPTTQPSGAPGVATTQGGGLLLNFKNASIDSVLDQLSAVAGFIVVRETKVTGRITLESKQPVTRQEAVGLLDTVLKTDGYAAIQMGRTLKILPRDQAKKADIPVHTGNDPSKIANTDELITQVIPIRYADAVQLKTDLTPLLNSNADVTANASSNSIIITDTSSNIRRVVEIISALDTHLAGSADVKVVQLKYASATDAAKLINDVFAKQQVGATQSEPGFGGFRFGRFRFGGGPPSQQGPQAASQERKQVPVVADADDRTNTVVVSGPTDTLEVVVSVLQKLDANPAVQQSVYVYNLKNGNADDLANVLNALINGTPLQENGENNGVSSIASESGFGSIGGSRSSGAFGSFGGSSSSSSRNTSRSTSGRAAMAGLSASANQAANQLQGQVTVVPNDDTNSLLVMTAPKNYDQIKTILDDLDRPVPQVLIKVLVAEVTHDNDSDIGVELANLNLNSGGKGQVIGTDSQIVTPPLSTPGSPALPLNPGFGETGAAGGLVARLVGSNLTATLRALATENKLDVLSRPYILTSDNQTASIIVGQAVPIPTNSRVTDTGQIINSLQYQNVGIILNVTPHINPDGLVTLDVAPQVSSLTGQTVAITQGLGAPVFDLRSSESRVAIVDGQTIVIGGMMQDQKTSNVQKVPLLGDIPLLGLLFQRNVTSKTKTELLFFLTPHVAQRPAYLDAMSHDEIKGTKILRNAVAPGMFNEYMRGMARGTTQPTTEPTTQP